MKKEADLSLASLLSNADNGLVVQKVKQCQ